jgi:cytochrome c-type biogenesis protein CcmH/NrfF
MGRVKSSLKTIADAINKSLRIKNTWIIKKGKLTCTNCGEIETKEDIISKNPKCPKCSKNSILLTYPDITQTEYKEYYDSMDDDEIDIFSDKKEDKDKSDDSFKKELKGLSAEDLRKKLTGDVKEEIKDKEIDEEKLKLKLKKKLKDEPDLKKKIEKRIPEEERSGWVSKLAHSIATKDIGIMNAFFLDDMQITKDEAQMLQEDWEFLIDFYSDKLEEILKWLPVLMIIVSHALIIGGRLKTYFTDKAKKEKEEKEKKDKEKKEKPKEVKK